LIKQVCFELEVPVSILFNFFNLAQFLPFKRVCCAKYDRGLDFRFWEILKPLKWTNITSFFLIKTNG
jgi:hypothetical protein